ncbi:mfs quinate transporter [Trichoderma arundinaceum]|uniref:Mfs quinate transporter n=1 Tax=Trichoderma arundinaceum TaxID=490622 RepID=A0A395P066_TRIAR|nr:mfs quinate transporter [Trichoderma arundinaceum]
MAGINLFYALTVIIIASGSIPKGYDEGGFAAVADMPSFLHDYGLLGRQWAGEKHELVATRANITSFGVLGAAFGAILALAITDRFGRLPTWRTFLAIWMSGFLITTFASGRLGLLLFSRLLSGLGAGGLTVVAPLYLTEIARTKTRGMVVSIYMVLLLSFLMFGFFISYGARKSLRPSRAQYRIVLCVPLIPTGIALIFSFFIKDTPRWLASKGRNEEALLVLSRLRKAPPDDAAVKKEYAEIIEQVRATEQRLSDTTTWMIIKEVATVPSYRKRFLLGLVMQTIAQWTGGNGITYYIPMIFRYAGVRGEDISLINSGAYGALKLVFTMIFTWGLIDVLGRRFCFMSGLFLQGATHVYMAIYMGIWIDGHNKSASSAAIASVFIYAVGWSIGLCTIQYLYGTEILPTRIRSVCYATNMTVHWFFQFAVVRAAPPMFDKLDVWGAYVFWACICFIGLVILGLWAPETKGVPIERMGELFSGPWYMGWKAKLDPQHDAEAESLERSPSADPGSGEGVQVNTQRFETKYP